MQAPHTPWAGGHRGAGLRCHQAWLSYPLESWLASSLKDPPIPFPAGPSLLPRLSPDRKPWFEGPRAAWGWPLVPDAVDEGLVALLGEHHAQGIGQALHPPLGCVLLQHAEHLLLQLGLLPQDGIHLQRGTGERGTRARGGATREMCPVPCSARAEGAVQGGEGHFSHQPITRHRSALLSHTELLFQTFHLNSSESPHSQTLLGHSGTAGVALAQLGWDQSGMCLAQEAARGSWSY